MEINIFGLIFGSSQLGLFLNLSAGVGWLIQNIIAYNEKITSHPIRLYPKQVKHYKIQKRLNILWLSLLCIGFFLQLLS